MISISISSTGAAGIMAHIAAVERVLADMSPALYEATDVLYRHTDEWFDSWGNESWPELKPATVRAKERRQLENPDHPNVATGKLKQSATSPTGPYSVRYVSPHQAIVGVDWENDGWQIPVVLSEGDEARGLPARPIFSATEQLVAELREVFSHALTAELALAR